MTDLEWRGGMKPSTAVRPSSPASECGSTNLIGLQRRKPSVGEGGLEPPRPCGHRYLKPRPGCPPRVGPCQRGPLLSHFADSVLSARDASCHVATRHVVAIGLHAEGRSQMPTRRAAAPQRLLVDGRRVRRDPLPKVSLDGTICTKSRGRVVVDRCPDHRASVRRSDAVRHGMSVIESAKI
jgi:hypothetical protein